MVEANSNISGNSLYTIKRNTKILYKSVSISSKINGFSNFLFIDKNQFHYIPLKENAIFSKYMLIR